MIQEAHTTTVVKTTSNSNTFKMKPNSKAFKILSDGLYSNKIRAVCREYLTNARDSHIAAGAVDAKIKIHVPNKLAPYLEVQDFGLGLSKQEVLDIYTVFFESTKTTSNEATGCFGLGSKSAFSVSDQFTVISVKDGHKVAYSCHINSDGYPDATLLNECSTQEQNTTIVQVPVRMEEINQWEEELDYVLYPYEESSYMLSTAINVKSPELKKALQQPSAVYIEGNITSCYVVMGNVTYVVSDIEKYLTPSLQKYSNVGGCVLHFDIGEVDITPSREQISFDKKTERVFKHKLNKLVIEKIRNLSASGEDFSNYWYLTNVLKTSNPSLYGVLEDIDGLVPELGNSSISRNYNQGNDRYTSVLPFDVPCFSYNVKKSSWYGAESTGWLGYKRTSSMKASHTKFIGKDVRILFSNSPVKKVKVTLENALEDKHTPTFLAQGAEELEMLLKYFHTDNYEYCDEYIPAEKQRKKTTRQSAEDGEILCRWMGKSSNKFEYKPLDITDKKVLYIEDTEYLHNLSYRQVFSLTEADVIVQTTKRTHDKVVNIGATQLNTAIKEATKLKKQSILAGWVMQSHCKYLSGAEEYIMPTLSVYKRYKKYFTSLQKHSSEPDCYISPKSLGINTDKITERMNKYYEEMDSAYEAVTSKLPLLSKLYDDNHIEYYLRLEKIIK